MERPMLRNRVLLVVTALLGPLSPAWGAGPGSATNLAVAAPAAFDTAAGTLDAGEAAAVAADPLAEASLPVHLRDRGTGVATSAFGTYVRKGELVVYPFFVHSRDDDTQYDPDAFGFPSPGEFRGGHYRASAEHLFLAYGLSDSLAWEVEASRIEASLGRSPQDFSGMPAKLTESGLGELKTRLNWRWLTERGRRPELFSYTEVLAPHDKDKPLIGAPDWTVRAGLGVTRGFRWGTLTIRAGGKYEAASTSRIDFGECTVEYLKRLSSRVRVFAAVAVLEGDETSLLTELQWSLRPGVVVKLSNGRGLSWHATDWAPGIGVLVRFPRR